MNDFTNSMKPLVLVSLAALFALAGCGSLDNRYGSRGVSRDTGTLIGAGTGALAGAAVSDGVIAPVAGAVGGAVVGRELSESEPN